MFCRFLATNEIVTAVFWKPGEGSHVGEPCGFLKYSHGKLEDVNCGMHPCHYICEKY